MTPKQTSHDFWLRLVDISDAISQDCESVEQLVCLLIGIEEGYRELFDPVDTFEEYVALKLCCAMRKIVETSQIS